MADDTQRTFINSAVNDFRKTGPVRRERNCNAFTAINLGDTTVLINGTPLFPSATPATVQGDKIEYEFDKDDIYVGQITIAFVQPVNANPWVQIIQVFYPNDK